MYTLLYWRTISQNTLSQLLCVDSNNLEWSVVIYCMLRSLLGFPQNAAEFFQLHFKISITPPCTSQFNCFTLFQCLNCIAFLLALLNCEYIQNIFSASCTSICV